jgi:hypothetical protein
MMSDELCQIAYNEGWIAYNDGVLCMDNPYNGVNATLRNMWESAWWDAFDEAE